MIKKWKLQWVAVFAFVLLLPGLSFAEIYKWRDADGMLHVTDDLHKVPRKFRSGVETIPATPVTGTNTDTGIRNRESSYVPAYERNREIDTPGGESLGWWESEFKRLRKKIKRLERNNKNMEQYIAVFEGGRRFGQVFGKEEVARYEEFKRDLPGDKKLLADVRTELVELTRKAEGSGVPPDIISKGIDEK